MYLKGKLQVHCWECLQEQTKCKEIDDPLFSLPSIFRSMGSLQQSLVCFEKRLVVAHELGGEGGGKAQAYWELGTLHSQLGNYEQALSCLEHQLNIARTAGVRIYLQKVLVSASSCPAEYDKLSFFLRKIHYAEKNVVNPAFNCQDKSLEAEASDALGGVYQLMADNETALQVCTNS